MAAAGWRAIREGCTSSCGGAMGAKGCPMEEELEVGRRRRDFGNPD